MRMEESFSVDMEVPESVDVGDSYRVNVTVENTGDFPLRGVTVRIGDQVKRIDLDLTERVKVGFDIVAPEEEGVQELKAEVYTDTIYGDVERPVWFTWNITDSLPSLNILVFTFSPSYQSSTVKSPIKCLLPMTLAPS